MSKICSFWIYFRQSTGASRSTGAKSAGNAGKSISTRQARNMGMCKSAGVVNTDKPSDIR